MLVATTSTSLAKSLGGTSKTTMEERRLQNVHGDVTNALVDFLHCNVVAEKRKRVWEVESPFQNGANVQFLNLEFSCSEPANAHIHQVIHPGRMDVFMFRCNPKTNQSKKLKLVTGNVALAQVAVQDLDGQKQRFSVEAKFGMDLNDPYNMNQTAPPIDVRLVCYVV